MNMKIREEDSVYAFIQARFNSKRLDGKALKPLLGKALLEWSVERAKSIHPRVKVAVLTGDRIENMTIIDWCRKRNILYFKGEEEDVLNRFNKAALEFKAKVVIRLTADNPLFDYRNIVNLLALHFSEKADYSTSKSEAGSGLPDGIGAEIFSASALSRLDSMRLSASHREHINDYILENKQEFKNYILRISQDYSGYRFTIDTTEDFERIQDWMRTIFPGKVSESDYWKKVVRGL
ncbi:cytidylyltransferase domain-containing protein [Candidatus Omnitrophota bacterium]